ncbi:cupredoxin domain-containing protein [Effusibacillus pohliae]|uniref:cupredoxin domain-containing protein n=1 Tax=Effusibacillus pohliae TaxID=232270 RepID=UPI0003786EAD|nr:cupredoxin domain-containing protein [Effusibacillus pohliae]
MKKMVKIIGIAAVSFGLVAGCGSGNTSGPSSDSSVPKNSQPSSNSSTAGNAKEVKLQASNWKIDVSQPEIKAGDKVKLSFSVKEGAHAFAIQNTNVKVDTMTAGEKVVEWTPDKPGEYQVYCTQICGPTDKHESMKATIVVK